MPLTIKIGRAEDNNIRIDDMYIGRYHAEIYIHSSGEMYIKDLSRNGVIVNGKKITPNTFIRIYRNDQIQLAKNLLDWQRIPDYSKTQISEIIEEVQVIEAPILAVPPQEKTSTFSDFMGEVTGSKDRFRSVKTFFYLLENTSDRLVEIAYSKDTRRFDPFEFFTIGLGLYLFNAIYLINLSEDISGDRVEAPEWMVSLILALSIFVIGWINYSLFNMLTESRKRWNDYIVLWFGFNGYIFIGFSFITFPFVIILFFDKPIWHNSNQIILAICMIINTFFCLIWVPLIWIKMNKKFWDTTYLRVGFIFFSIIGISWLVFKFIYSYIKH